MKPSVKTHEYFHGFIILPDKYANFSKNARAKRGGYIRKLYFPA